MSTPSTPASDAPSWIAFRRPRANARLRLFCLPFAGGGASSYRAWADQLSSHIEVIPIQPPGREDRLMEPPLRRMEDLVEGLIKALMPLLSDLPFVFFGHSLGAIVALETTRRLIRDHRLVPAHLIVSARPAPHLPLRRTPVFDLPRSALEQWLRRLNGTPELVLQNQELMDLMLPMLRADLHIDDTYRTTAEPVLPCRLTVLGGHQDSEATPEELREWRFYTEGAFELHLLQGNHFFPFNESWSEALAVLAAALSNIGSS